MAKETINVAYVREGTAVETSDSEGNRFRYEGGEKLPLSGDGGFTQDQLQALYDAGSVELREEAAPASPATTAASSGTSETKGAAATVTPKPTGTAASTTTADKSSGASSGGASK